MAKKEITIRVAERRYADLILNGKRQFEESRKIIDVLVEQSTQPYLVMQGLAEAFKEKAAGMAIAALNCDHPRFSLLLLEHARRFKCASDGISEAMEKLVLFVATDSPALVPDKRLAVEEK